MFLLKILVPCFLIAIVDLRGARGQHEGVPVRSAPVYPDGYPAPDSQATSVISNGRISAHLEYVDRGEGTHRGDITRAGSQQGRRGYDRTQTGGASRTYSTSGSATPGSSSAQVDYSQSGSHSYDTSGSDNTRRTSDETSSSARTSSGGTHSTTPDRTSGGRTYSATSGGRTHSATSDRTSVGRTHSSTSDRTSGIRTHSATSDRTSGRTYTATSDRTSGGRRYGLNPESTNTRRTYETNRRSYITSGTQTRPYDPYATRRQAQARQPYGASARSTHAQPDRRGSYYQQCPTDNFRVLIEGTECHVAIDSLGSHVCYDDRVLRDRRCCERCRQIKNHQKPGCEYGDRTRHCTSLTASQCYIRSNRNICCQTCERLRNPSQPNCEYGDLSPTCAQMPRRMCSLQENQRICCQTCERMRDPFRPECPYGDRSNQCGIISGGACYNIRVRDTCCAACARLDVGLPGCQYGDHSAVWTSPAGELDCETYTRIYGLNACADPNFSSRCCQSCRAYVPRNTQS